LSSTRIGVFGHPSADPQSVATAFGASTHQKASPELDLAIFAINPNTGIEAESIQAWADLDEFQIPRLVVVTGLEEGEGDFDDAVLIGRRVFDQLVTPFLVLHDDAGSPCALISLSNEKIFDYSTPPAQVIESDSEHKTLVGEFVEEYREQIDGAGEGAFEAGLLFPAIPIWIERNIGVDIVASYIERINQNLIN
jgi:hypothetical protein